MAVVIDDLAKFDSLVGTHLGYSAYKLIDQASINLFADLTGDHQWIHVDTAQAAKGPFGTTIAHGYFTLSLIPALMQDVLKIENISQGINMGCNKVRFTGPVPVDSLLRLGASIAQVEHIEGGVQVVIDVTLEVKDAPKPACVAQTVVRLYA
jgi:acyl dehydratase